MWRSDGRVWIWQMPGKRHLSAYVMPTVKFGVGGVMVWSCFSWRGPAPLVVLHGTITAQVYINVLSIFLLPTVEEQFGDGDCIFQHNRAPVHNVRSVVDWPAQSPGLINKEHLWDVLECRLHARPHQPISIPLLSATLREEWDTIPPETFQYQIEHMPVTVEAVIKTNGGPTSY